MSAFHLLHKGMSFLATLMPEQIYCTIKSSPEVGDKYLTFRSLDA